MAKIKCFIKNCKVSRNTNSALVHHLHQNHSKTQREKAPKSKYSELLYDLCKCGFLVNFKKLFCKQCGAQHLKKSPKYLSLEKKSDFKNNQPVEKDNLPGIHITNFSQNPQPCSRLLTTIVERVFQYLPSSVLFHKDLTSWKKLAMITKCLLLKPNRAGRKTKRFNKNWTLERFEKWKSGEIMDLWIDTLKFQLHSNNIHESSPEIDQQRRCISLAREGNASKSLKSLISTVESGSFGQE